LPGVRVALDVLDAAEREQWRDDHGGRKVLRHGSMSQGLPQPGPSENVEIAKLFPLLCGPSHARPSFRRLAKWNALRVAMRLAQDAKSWLAALMLRTGGHR